MTGTDHCEKRTAGCPVHLVAPGLGVFGIVDRATWIHGFRLWRCAQRAWDLHVEKGAAQVDVAGLHWTSDRGLFTPTPASREHYYWHAPLRAGRFFALQRRRVDLSEEPPFLVSISGRDLVKALKACLPGTLVTVKEMAALAGLDPLVAACCAQNLEREGILESVWSEGPGLKSKVGRRLTPAGIARRGAVCGAAPTSPDAGRSPDRPQLLDVVVAELLRWARRGRHAHDLRSPGEEVSARETELVFLTRPGVAPTIDEGALRMAVAAHMAAETRRPIVFMTDYGPGPGVADVGEAIGFPATGWAMKHRMRVDPEAGRVEVARGETGAWITLGGESE